MDMTFAFRIGGMGSGERVQRAAVLGERRAGNEWSGQRWSGSEERGTIGAGSGDGRMGSWERVERAAVMGERGAGIVGRA
ncbi:hypothetical protein CJ231_05975 [Hoylesella buccalis]|uniref:Uncharacterized protein n=1 Tax=Hoylesella buccalis TaxID=28127 RepID=A0A2N6QR22_9BACT|nr:hypothetical protein CJ231_05975 [Hoylesella buccalis]